MSRRESLIPEHNAACERAGGLTCKCPCRSAGHQVDLVSRAITCSDKGELELLRADLEKVYGGYRSKIRDGSVRSRRKVPKDLNSCKLDVRRGASWAEQIGLDEVLRSVYEGVSKNSIGLTKMRRESRRELVQQLAEYGTRVASTGALVSHVDAHVWCSVLACVNARRRYSGLPYAVKQYAEICYPRCRSPKMPGGASTVWEGYVTEVNRWVGASGSVAADLDEALWLYGAACCPDLWQHPKAVRFSLRPMISGGVVPSGTVSAAVIEEYDNACLRWRIRKNW